MRRNKSFFIISALLAVPLTAAAHMLLIKPPQSPPEVMIKVINVIMGGYLGFIWVFAVSRLVFCWKAEKLAKGSSAIFISQKRCKAVIALIIAASFLFDLAAIFIQGSSSAFFSIILFFLMEPSRFLYYEDGNLRYIDDCRTEPLDVIDASLLETEKVEQLRVELLTKEPKPVKFDVLEEHAAFFDKTGQFRNSSI
jgi:hypothetical protein